MHNSTRPAPKNVTAQPTRPRLAMFVLHFSTDEVDFDETTSVSAQKPFPGSRRTWEKWSGWSG